MEKTTHNREDGGYCTDGGRSNKQLASSAEESNDQLEMYDKVLLCPHSNAHLHKDPSLCLEHDHDASPNGADRKLQQNQDEPAKGSNGGGRGCHREKGNKKEVDIRTLQSQCEQAISRAEIRTANELLNQIRQHSSPYGDGHYFDNALEARVWLALGQHYMLLLPSREFQLLIL